MPGTFWHESPSFLKLWLFSFSGTLSFTHLNTASPGIILASLLSVLMDLLLILNLVPKILCTAALLQVGLSLAYHKSDSELPTQSTVTAWPLSSDLISQTAAKRPGRAVLKNSTSFRLPKAEAFLRTMPLPRGFEEFLADLRDTLGLSPPQLVVEASQPAVEDPQLVMEVPQLATEAPQPAVEVPQPAVESPQPAVEAQPLTSEAQSMEIEAPTEAPH
jgi:hypothetical protein